MIVFDLPFLFVLLGFALLFIFFYRTTKKRAPPFIDYSILSQFAIQKQGARARYSDSPNFIYCIAAVLFAIALLDIRIMEEAAGEVEKASGRALFLVLDQSGSMKQPLVLEEKRGDASFLPKIELLKSVSKNLVENRPHDFLGLVSFARSAQILSPLTLDHTPLLEQLARLQVVAKMEDDGTAIGYAIYKTAHLIDSARSDLQKEKGAPQINDAAIILVTDGFQSPHPGDVGNALRTIGIEEAANFAKEKKIHLYIINIEPLIETEEYAPQRNLMARAASETGGKLFTVVEPSKLQAVFDAIDKLEKSELPEMAPPTLLRTHSLFPIFTFFALLLVGCAFFLETTLLRRWP